MIHLSLRPDLEGALRKISTESGYALTTICTALLHLGLASGAKNIDEACALHVRPMGRPVTDVPVLEGPKKQGTSPEPVKPKWPDTTPRYKTVKGKRVKLEPWE